MGERVMDGSRLASWIFACAVPPEDRETVLGDLAEEFAMRREETPHHAAAMWYWTQIARSMPWLLCAPIRRNGWLHTSAVATAACLAQAVVELAIATAIARPPAALMLVLFSLAVVSCLANLYCPGAGTIVVAVALTSAFASGVSAGPAHLLLAMSAPSASVAGAALALNARRFL
jgi:hypothetical protein